MKDDDGDKIREKLSQSISCCKAVASAKSRQLQWESRPTSIVELRSDLQKGGQHMQNPKRLEGILEGQLVISRTLTRSMVKRGREFVSKAVSAPGEHVLKRNTGRGGKAAHKSSEHLSYPE